MKHKDTKSTKFQKLLWSSCLCGSCPSQPLARSRGFTLFELIVVLVLIALAAGLVLPSFSRGMQSIELEATSRDLVTRMKRARSEAIAGQKVFRIMLFQGETADDDSGEGNNDYYVLADDFEQPIRRYPLPEGISIELDESREFPLKASFYPNGRSSGGQFILKNAAGKELQIQLDPITGFAKVLKESISENQR